MRSASSRSGPTISTSTDDPAAPPSGVIRSRRGDGSSALATVAKTRRTRMERIRISSRWSATEGHAVALKVCKRINALGLQLCQQLLGPMFHLKLQFRLGNSDAKAKLILMPKQGELRVSIE